MMDMDGWMNMMDMDGWINMDLWMTMDGWVDMDVWMVCILLVCVPVYAGACVCMCALRIDTYDKSLS